MKKLIAVFSLGMLVAGSSFAQTAPPQKDKKVRTEQRGMKADKARKSPEERAQIKTERLSQRLDLNAHQKNQLQALNKRHAEEIIAMRASYRGAEDKTQMREARKASHAKWQAELKGLLSDQQYAKYEADRAQMRNKRSEDHDGAKGKRSGEHRKQRS